MDSSELDRLLQPQMLRQRGNMDCGVVVFARLADLTEEEILRDQPDAFNGITDIQWESLLISKGRKVTRYRLGEAYPLPCAHLVETSHGSGRYHWIYRAEDGGVHDPSPAFEHCSPHWIKENFDTCYGALILTFALT